MMIDLSDVTELRLNHSRAMIRNDTGAATTYRYADHEDWRSLYNDLLSEHQPDNELTTAEPGVVLWDRRWRCQVYSQLEGWSVVLRLLPERALSLSALEFDREAVLSLMRGRRLVLIAGATSSGKSTTAISAITELEEEGELGYTISAEDPIEFVFPHDTIEQRQIGIHTTSYDRAVIEAMRQSPRTIFVGEIRDEETADATLQAAMSGHRVIATIHAGSAEEAILRFRNRVSPGRRAMIPFALQGVMAQALLYIEGNRPLPVYETLEITSNVAAILEQGEAAMVQLTHESRRQGRETMDEMRARFVSAGLIES